MKDIVMYQPRRGLVGPVLIGLALTAAVVGSAVSIYDPARPAVTWAGVPPTKPRARVPAVGKLEGSSAPKHQAPRIRHEIIVLHDTVIPRHIDAGMSSDMDRRIEQREALRREIQRTILD